VKPLKPVKPLKNRPTRDTSAKRQRVVKRERLGVKSKAKDNSSDSDNDVDPAEENVLKITETIGGTLTRLFRLSNSVRRSGKTNRARKIMAYSLDERSNKAQAELREYTRSFLRIRFPMAPKSSDKLFKALVEANALRFKRLHYQQSHRIRIDLSNVQIPEKTTPVGPKVLASAPTVRFAPGISQRPGKRAMPIHPPPPATNATTAQQTQIAVLYADSTTENPRARSALANKSSSFPPMPSTKECPYCGVIIEFNNQRMWQ
jgi:hypothetical protein